MLLLFQIIFAYKICLKYLDKYSFTQFFWGKDQDWTNVDKTYNRAAKKKNYKLLNATDSSSNNHIM